MRFHILPLALAAVSVLPANAPASEKQVEMRWSELGTFLTGGNLLGRGSEAMLMLPNGTVVQGRIVEVRQDELVLKVAKSSEEKAYPKGQSSIPRSSVTTIRLRQTKGYGRAIGTIAGIWGGAGLGALVAMSSMYSNDDEAARAGILAMWVGATVGGYYAGRSFDRKTTLVKVLPD